MYEIHEWVSAILTPVAAFILLLACVVGYIRTPYKLEFALLGAAEIIHTTTHGFAAFCKFYLTFEWSFPPLAVIQFGFAASQLLWYFAVILFVAGFIPLVVKLARRANNSVEATA
jgi:hypothetical protein